MEDLRAICVRWHNVTYTSDANPAETSYEITIVRALSQGRMSAFHNVSHACAGQILQPEWWLTTELQSKGIASSRLQRSTNTARSAPEAGLHVPQDVFLLTGYDNSGK